MTLAAPLSAAAASPSLRAGLPGCSASVRYSAMMAAVLRFSALLSSHSTLSASRPSFAAQKLLATTATPRGTCTTSTTPGTALAAVASNDFTVAPNSGGRCSKRHQHVRESHIDGELRRAVGLSRHIDARQFLADELEVLRVLQRHLVRHRQARRLGGQIAERRLAIARRMTNDAALDRQARRRHIPFCGRGARPAWRAPWRRRCATASRNWPWPSCRRCPASCRTRDWHICWRRPARIRRGFAPNRHRALRRRWWRGRYRRPGPFRGAWRSP